jgi:hypothetical protein
MSRTRGRLSNRSPEIEAVESRDESYESETTDLSMYEMP